MNAHEPLLEEVTGKVGLHTGTTILVVEDDEGLNKLVVKKLSEHGFCVDSASTGAEAIAHITNNRPDLLLLDFRLPDMTALDLIERLVKKKAMVPFIIMTGRGDEDTAVQLMKMGARDYIIKRSDFLDHMPFVVSAVREQVVKELLISQMEAALRQSEERLRLLFENAKDAIFWIDPETHSVLNCNRAAAVLIGSSIEDIIGMDIGEFHPPEVRNLYSDLLGTAMEDKEGFSMELYILTRAGTRIPTILSASKVNVNGVIISQGIYHDISARKEAEVKEERIKEMQQITKMKDAFLANMSHELRSPLNGIIGYSEVLSDELYGPLNDRQKDQIEKVLACSQHLLSLINDVLDMSKIEAGMFKVEKSWVDLKCLLDEVAAAFKIEAAKKGQDLGMALAGDEAIVQGDPLRIRQVLMNLVSNAVKFTPNGGHIDLSVEPKETEYTVSVRDDGIGMSEEDITHAFEPFWQSRDVAVCRTGGTGLGLTISKRLVQMMGGDLWLESAKGKGTTVRFTLPSYPRKDG